MIKRLFLSLCGFVTLLLVLAVLAIFFFLDAGIENGVERFGPRIAKARVELGDVHTSLLKGQARIDDLVIRNPAGYDASYALRIGSAELKIDPGTVFDDVIVVKSFRVHAPGIIVQKENGVTNLQQLQRNIESYFGPTQEEPADEQPAAQTEGKRYIIREFIVEGGTLTGSLMGVEMNTALPRIELHDIGASQDGFTAEQAGSAMLAAILDAASRSAQNQAVDLLRDPNKAVDTINRATGLFNQLFGGKDDDKGG